MKTLFLHPPSFDGLDGGAKVAVDPEGSLSASTAIDFVARVEFDYTCKEVAKGRPLETIAGISYRGGDGSIRHNPPRAIIEDMDAGPLREGVEFFRFSHAHEA